MKNNIAIYFYGSLSQIYQLQQWYRVFEKLDNALNLEIIIRSKKVFDVLKDDFEINTTFIDTIDDLLSYYEKKDFDAIIYVNNGFKNFQSLIFHRAMHIHINHGESEKSSMHSNQSKAYDYIFVCADAAVDRYKRHLLNFQSQKYIKIGRPQLDFINKIPKDDKKKVILYAPTDESTHISMRYTSLERIGKQIVDTILNDKEYTLIYRPHPATGTNSKIVNKINKRIIGKINKSNNAYVDTKTEALDLCSIVDLAIFDNSSLIIDFMHFNKPILITDMFLEQYHDTRFLKILDAGIMINETNINDLSEIIQSQINEDVLYAQRNDIKEYYLGNYKDGESSDLFVQQIRNIINERKILLEK